MVDIKSHFFNGLNIFKEKFFTEKIIVGEYELYPYYDLNLVYSENKSVSLNITASILPLAILIKETIAKNDNEYYIYFLDESKRENKDFIHELLKNFVDNVLN